MPTMDTPTAYQLQARLILSARYHDRREAFFDRWDKLAKGIAVIGGAASVTTLLAQSEPWRVAVALTITITSTASLVFALSQRARVHHDLKKRYQAIEAQFVSLSAPTDEQVAAWFAEIAQIEGDEPPVLPALARICQNETMNQMGRMAYIQPVGFWRTLLAHWISWPLPPAKALDEPPTALKA
jgi:hypothetical protein